jgi:hypothetical protein
MTQSDFLCDAVHFYEGDTCDRAAGHSGEHRDMFGLTWTDAECAGPHLAPEKAGREE